MSDYQEANGAGFAASVVAPSFPELAAEMRRRRELGAPADVWSVLADFPELVQNAELVTDLACEEFSQRRAAGENLSIGQFAARFPCSASLRGLLETRHICDLLLASGQETVSWPAPGEMLFGFALLRELGRGAFARVFLAHQPTVGDRPVVIKVSWQGDAAEDEADALGNLVHPNIVPVLSVHGADDSMWTAVCMPYHGTVTLAHALEQLYATGRAPRRAAEILEAAVAGLPEDVPPPASTAPSPFPPGATYREGVFLFAAQLADALATVHDAGLCHRDLKPANVLLTPAGQPMLIDFNLSCDASAVGEQPGGGTLPYMAPEQLVRLLHPCDNDAALDARADLFGLGIVLYELLTGKHPFGPFPADLVLPEMAALLRARHQQGPHPLPADLRRRYPEAARLLGSCLALDPDARPRTAAQVAAALRRLIRPPRRHIGVGFFLVAAALLLAASPVGNWVWPRAEDALAQLWRAEPGEAYRAAAHAYADSRYQDALRYLDSSIARDPNDARARFARGRVHLALGHYEDALTDHRRADQMLTHRAIKASLAFCFNQRVQRAHTLAVGYYREALDLGFENAAVRLNLACSLLQAVKDGGAEVRVHLNRALELDPRLGPAYHARMRLALLRGPALTPEELQTALQDMAAALAIPPNSADLRYDAARVCALAATRGRSQHLADQAMTFAYEAVELGLPPTALLQDAYLNTALGHMPAFNDLVARTDATIPQPTPARLVVDPLGGSFGLD